MNLRFRLAVIANLSPIALTALFFRGGAPAMWPLLVFSSIFLSYLNLKSVRTWKQLTFLGVEHILSTITAHMLAYHLYTKFVSDDAMSHIISQGGLLIGAIWTTILLVVTLVLWNKQKQKRDASHNAEPKTSP